MAIDLSLLDILRGVLTIYRALLKEPLGRTAFAMKSWQLEAEVNQLVDWLADQVILDTLRVTLRAS